MSITAGTKSKYWDAYYAESAKRVPPPSQFAAFAAQEFGDFSNLVDVGCGSGRDSIFFAQHGFQVLGVDGSQSAIDSCRSSAARLGVGNVTFEQATVQSGTFDAVVAQHLDRDARSALFYARFLLHAITEAEQESLLDSIAKASRPGDRLAVEYRTTRDADLSKVTASHYRRFIDPAQLLVSVASLGFEVSYAAEGFGYAKYRNDDAHVARAVFVRV